MNERRNKISFYLNGEWQEISFQDSENDLEEGINFPISPLTTLAEYIRYKKGLSGTKIVCEEGDCGACTVLVFKPPLLDDNSLSSQNNQKFRKFVPVNSCIFLLGQADGSSVITIEGLKNQGSMNMLSQDSQQLEARPPNAQKGKLHPVQKALIEKNGVQCGFCTPGITMALAGLHEEFMTNSLPYDLSIKNEVSTSLSGNLCRCTGYSTIIQAGVFAIMNSRLELQSTDPNQNSKMNPYWDENQNLKNAKTLTSTGIPTEIPTGIDPIRENCFQTLNERYSTPSMIKNLILLRKGDLKVQTKKNSFFAPKEWHQAILEMSKNKSQYKIIGGGTDLNVLLNKHKLDGSHFMSLQQIPELHFIKRLLNNCIFVGAQVTIDQLNRFLKKEYWESFSRRPQQDRGSQQNRNTYSNGFDYFDYFASPQIRNLATLVGNVAHASPIGDSIPFLLATDAQVIVESSERGKREIPIHLFFKGYKQIDLHPDELIYGIKFNYPFALEKNQNLYFKSFKISQREDLDISIVNGSFYIQKNEPLTIRLAVGGMSPYPVRLYKSEQFLLESILKPSKSFNQTNFETLLKIAYSEVSPISDIRGSAQYRKLLLKSFFDDMMREVFYEL